MMTIRNLIGTTVLGAAVTLAALFGVAGSAQARTYGGVYTPPFGLTFPDLEWSGSANFFIPDACEALPTGWKANSGPTCGGMTITNGKLVFSSIGGSFVDEVFNFGSASVVNMYVDGGSLHGVDSLFVGGFTSTHFTDVGGTPVWFWLKFEHEIAAAENLSVVQLYYTEVGEGPECLKFDACTGISGHSANTAILVLTPVVPEPGTYALLLAGLVAVGAYARRRNR